MSRKGLKLSREEIEELNRMVFPDTVPKGPQPLAEESRLIRCPRCNELVPIRIRVEGMVIGIAVPRRLKKKNVKPTR